MRENFVWLASFVLTMLAIPACQENPSSPEPGIDRAHPLARLIDFTTARISDNSAVTRSNNDVSQISFGIVVGPTYEEQATVTPLISVLGGSYVLRFDTTISVPDSDFTVTVRTRLYLKTGAPLDFDTTLVTYHHPYSSTEVVLLPSDIAYVGAVVQDIAFVDDIMYILHVGDDRIFRLLPGHQSIDFYMQIHESDFLAGDSFYVFVDNGNELSRVNVITNSVDLNLRFIPGGLLLGIAAESGKVYVLYPYGELLVFDRVGTVLDSVGTNARNVFHCAVNEGVLHAFDFSNKTIYRFDTRSHADLHSLKAPARNIEGLEIHQGWLYYGDFEKRAVLRVPLSDLIEN